MPRLALPDRPLLAPVTAALLLALATALLAGPAVASPRRALTLQPTWARSINWSGASVEALTDLAVSRDGTTLWACGSTGPGDGDLDLALVRVPANGARASKYTWDGESRLDDAAAAVATAPDGSVYTTGVTTRRLADTDIVLVRWSRTGRVLRAIRYAPSRYGDTASDVVVDRSGNVTVCGTKGGVTTDWVVVSWSADGRRRWTSSFGGRASGDDSPSEMVVDGEGYVYVTGSETRADGSYAVRTIKFSRKGARLWSRSWAPRETSASTAGSIARREKGGIYVACGEADGGAVVLRYTAAGQASRVVTGTARFWVEDMAATSDGGWVLGGAGLANPYVERYSSLGALLTGWLLEPPLDPEFPSDVRCVAADSSGRIYWAGFATHTDQLVVGCRGRTASTVGWNGGWDAEEAEPIPRAVVYSGGALFVAGTHGSATDGKDMFILRYR